VITPLAALLKRGFSASVFLGSALALGFGGRGCSWVWGVWGSSRGTVAALAPEMESKAKQLNPMEIKNIARLKEISVGLTADTFPLYHSLFHGLAKGTILRKNLGNISTISGHWLP